MRLGLWGREVGTGGGQGQALEGAHFSGLPQPPSSAATHVGFSCATHLPRRTGSLSDHLLSSSRPHPPLICPSAPLENLRLLPRPGQALPFPHPYNTLCCLPSPTCRPETSCWGLNRLPNHTRRGRGSA